ncbi:MAG: hypothetical protein ATN35_05125 [Epulopiscium sp. Nele67-Bin004]|nr:MAG: hypothetical protein ATN35_05125 [Epulopiscium sp. Nele67-Bin004]
MFEVFLFFVLISLVVAKLCEELVIIKRPQFLELLLSCNTILANCVQNISKMTAIIILKSTTGSNIRVY